MPVVRSGNFALYGYSLLDPSTLTDGAHIQPADPTNYYLCNSGSLIFQPDIPTPMPCQPSFSGPVLMDTTTEGTGIAASSPPAGFRLKTRPAFTGPNLRAGMVWISPVNNAGTWSMGGKIGLNATDGAHVGQEMAVEQDDTLLTYIELLDPLLFSYTAVNGFPFAYPFPGNSGGPSTPTSGPRILGGYQIVWWWWVLPDRDRCGNNNSPNPDDSDAHLVFASPDDPPGGGYELFDPDDPDNASPQPVITNLVPNHGRGGTRVQIIGSGFGDGANVQFDGSDAEDIDVRSQYQVFATAPSHANGFANVAVINVDGVSS